MSVYDALDDFIWNQPIHPTALILSPAEYHYFVMQARHDRLVARLVRQPRRRRFEPGFAWRHRRGWWLRAKHRSLSAVLARHPYRPPVWG